MNNTWQGKCGGINVVIIELQCCSEKITKWNVLFSAGSLLKHGTTRGYCFSLLTKIYEAVIHVCSVHFVFLV